MSIISGVHHGTHARFLARIFDLMRLSVLPYERVT